MCGGGGNIIEDIVAPVVDVVELWLLLWLTQLVM